MFEFFFNCPVAVYQKGTLVLLSGWPVWLLGVLAAAAALLVAFIFARKPIGVWRALALGTLEWAALALLLLLVWQPAFSISRLKPQQNVIAVVVDASASMAREQRIDEARRTLEGGLLTKLRERFLVRIYEAGRTLERVERPPAKATQPVTMLGEALKAAAAESATLPIGAVVLLSDGADNAGGLDSESMAALRRTRIPVNTVGFGGEKLDRDVEISDALVATRSLAGARLAAVVTLRQAGFAGRTAKLSVKEGAKVLASREIKLAEDGLTSREVISFPAGEAGAKTLRVGVDLIEGETNNANNALTRLVNVEDRKPRLLYFEGDPRWEMKFIRRAAELDKNLDLASILRTTENKFYRQGIADAKELEHGFPDSVEELFRYQGLIIGDVEAGYFTPAQQTLIQEFVDRRGGGVLFLGGRAALSDGGWNRSPLAEILPVSLPERKGTFHRDPATVDLTPAGRESLVMRLEETPEKNAARWKAMPYLADYQETGAVKPGAQALAELMPGSGGRFPLLVTQNYGRGRVALFATGGSWRWRMAQDSKDRSHELFWRQLLRWLVSDVTGHVTAMTTKAVYSDDTRIPLRAEVRDRNYLPASGVQVEAHVVGPGGVADIVTLRPVTGSAGAYAGEWKADAPGSYLVEVSARQGDGELGRDVFTFQREDGVAENFRTEQNKELLERLAQQTGGRYYKPSETARLASEIEYSEAGVSVKETREVWSAPAAFLLLAGFKAAEWFLRRRWGGV